MSQISNEVEPKALLDWLVSLDFVQVKDEDEKLILTVDEDILPDTLKEFLSKLYDFEKALAEKHVNNVILRLKGINVEALTEAFRFSMTREDLSDPVMLLNLIDFVKTYNTLDDSFFTNEDIYFSELSEMLDVRLEIQEDIEAFVQKLAIYFISLFKSCNKFLYTAHDYHITLPNLYRNFFLSTDLLTCAGIFTISKPFNTEDCVYIDNAMEYILAFQEKNSVSFNFLESFLKEKVDVEN